MPRTARAAVGGMAYHVLNRGNDRRPVFRKPADYAAFVDLLIEGKRRTEVSVLGYCLMPNHWHVALIPRRDEDMAAYVGWVSNTHVKRYRAAHPESSGHLYQGRYKSFVVEQDEYLLTLLRYVEANPLRAGLVERAERWAWSSLGCGRATTDSLLDAWPVDRPANWTALVNRAIDRPPVEAIRTSISRDRPLGGPSWVRRTAAKLGLQYTLRPRGRPRKVIATK